jgi:hypothetical protein
LVAVDPRIAYSAAIKHFEQFPLLGRSPEAVAREYLAKVFQVVLTLPIAAPSTTRKLIYEELFHGAFQPSRLGLDDVESNDIEVGVEIEEVSELQGGREYKNSLPEEVEVFFALSNACNFSNPRQLWRLKQAWQLMKGISFPNGIGVGSIRPWMRALFLSEYLLQAEAIDRREIAEWLANQSRPIPDFLTRLALGDVVDGLYSNYLSRAEVVKYVLLPSAS